MNLRKLIFEKNACYKTGKKITVKGIMVHSTGANNPNLKRYVGPDDGLLGVNANNNHWNQDLPDGRQVCVHGFIGKLADGRVATYQTLPWDMRGWHGGGSSNDTHIGFEICEDGLTDAAYFGKVYQEAVELCAMLCKQYSINPLQKDKSGGIICHSEGNVLGIASNHGDVMHWFPKHGKSMDTFRADVKKTMDGTTQPIQTPTVASSFKVGGVVTFTGSLHYASAQATTGTSCKPGTAKVTVISNGAKHPYHLVAEKSGGSTVYGWVDSANVTATTPAKSAEEITVDNAIADEIITDRTHWLGVLTGTTTPSRANIKTLMDNAHEKIKR